MAHYNFCGYCFVACCMYTGNEIMVQKMDNYLEISRENNKACPGSTVILYFSRYTLFLILKALGTMLNLSMGGR